MIIFIFYLYLRQRRTCLRECVKDIVEREIRFNNIIRTSLPRLTVTRHAIARLSAEIHYASKVVIVRHHRIPLSPARLLLLLHLEIARGTWALGAIYTLETYPGTAMV